MIKQKTNSREKERGHPPLFFSRDMEFLLREMKLKNKIENFNIEV